MNVFENMLYFVTEMSLVNIIVYFVDEAHLSMEVLSFPVINRYHDQISIFLFFIFLLITIFTETEIHGVTILVTISTV
jgi:hypothetical protein